MSRFFYFKLAITNIKKNAKTYVPYMITSILTISMFYIICSLGNNPNVSKACGTDSMKYVLFLGTWVCGIFAVIFLFYTNSFLMKRRKKEFGLYNILGMEKKHISRVVLCETLIMSVISLGLGLVVGILFDKLMLLVILSMFTVEIPLGFHISPESFPATLTLFTGIFVLIFLNSIRQIHLAKPIELLQGSTVGEKEPKAKWLIALIGAICLGSGYYISLTTTNPIAALNMFFIAVILVIIGTYLLFTAGSIVLLKALRKNKNYYYKTKNFISISGMIYRMKQNAVGLANICILSTMVLVMISSTFSLWNGMNDVLDSYFPREFTFTPFEYSEESASDLKAWVNNTLDEYNVEPKDIADYSYLNFAVVQDKDTFIMDRNNSAYADMINEIRNLFFITLDDYNRMTNSNETLKEDEVLVYSNRDQYNEKQMKISDKTFKVKGTLDDFPNNRLMTTNVASSHFIVVKDTSVLNDLDKIQNEIYGDVASSIQYYYAFNVDANTEKIIDINNKFENDIIEMGTYEENTNKYVYEGRFDCRETEKNDFIGMYGGLYFIGVFLGVLFIIATILIMYYKQISEGYDDKGRFEIMQKVGISHEEIKKSIHSQVLTVFFLPLIVAGIHIAFAFPFITRLLAILNLTNVKLFAMATVGGFLLFSVFYAVVYRITARSYYKIVS
ncbi:FtsX-like permease family protein [Intestinibacter sp.]|uniref:FtsX-like permease family protein n=1 Tax=Intestinibacter sp. TaxID=1965304 RepID=UPI003F16996A